MINREITNKMKELMRYFPVVSLTGPRQSGKTTLIKNIFKKKPYVSFEDPDTRLLVENDPRSFLGMYKNGAVFDEIQRVPFLFSYIQSIVDESNKQGLYILSGSQNFLLLENISQTLAGRVGILKLLPFSISELKKAGYNYDNIDEYIIKGFYPRIYDKNIPPEDFYPNYLQTYIERDIRSLRNITDLSIFTRFLQLCAGRIGQILDLTLLANDTGVSLNTVKAWLSVLEASYVIFLLHPYHKNIRKRLIKMPKMYFYDTGFASALLGIRKVSNVHSHFMRGHLFENLVIAEFYKFYFNKGIIPNLFYLRNKSGYEIDLVIESNSKTFLIEIKSGKTYSDHFFKNILYYKNITDLNLTHSFVIYDGNQNVKYQDSNLMGWKDLQTIFKLINKE